MSGITLENFSQSRVYQKTFGLGEARGQTIGETRGEAIGKALAEALLDFHGPADTAAHA